MSETPSLHPQNDRIPDRGLKRFEAHYRMPPVYVANGDDTKHQSPQCPKLVGRPYRAWCREEALYAFGENWCDTCFWGSGDA